MSVPTDILGAVASNAGDEFHEVWALREALSLLDPTSDLTALTVEGVAHKSAKPKDDQQWDGVDCGLYYGGSDIDNAERIDLVQLKYSVSAPNMNWTLGRLTKNTSKTGNNSVARRLGNAFNAAAKGKSIKVIEDQISVSLVSNQPISKSLIGLIKKINRGLNTSQDAKDLKDATGLSNTRFPLFCRCLKLRGGEAARSVLKSNLVQKIATVTDFDVSDTLNDLKQTMRERMLPESGWAPITRATVLTWFKVGDPLSLFPCAAKLEPTKDPIPRKVVSDLAKAVIGNPLVCLEGGGACGKTTTAMSLNTELPDGSRTVIFDCYGAGSYFDPSQSRHGPDEAFTQLSNDLAILLRVPFLIPHKDNPNIAASFRRRLELAAGMLTEEAPDGLLVVIVDAADNAAFAADKPTPPDPCFVHEFVRFSRLPSNVRFVVTARTSRLDSLKLPSDCPRIVCGPFELAETDQFVRRIWPDATAEQVEQFHHLSNHVPRLQASTVSHVETLEDALNLLRPNGKSLDDLFAAILRDSSVRLGGDGILDTFCGALSVLSTPAPTEFLAELCGESEAFVSEVCDDLSPNVRLTSKGFEFANEDFEAFVRQQGENKADALKDKAANLLLNHRHSSEYAAIHLFNVLAEAGRQTELFEVLEEDDSTRAITDKVVRRRTDLRRLKSAVTIATANGDAVQAGKTVLIGAEAMRTDRKVSELIEDNIELSAVFSETTVRQEILRNSKKRALHGPLQMHLAKETALRPEAIPLSREYVRLAVEWVRERFHLKDNERLIWNLSDGDLIALVYAVFKNKGWEGAIDFCWTWKPRLVPITLFTGLIDLVLKREGPGKVREARAHLPHDARWITTIFLQRAGESVFKKELNEELKALCETEFPDFKLSDSYQPDESHCSAIINNLLFFADICRHRSCAKRKVVTLINKAWPEDERPARRGSTFMPIVVDFTLRAEMALAILRNKSFSAKDAFRIEDTKDNENNRDRRKNDEEFLSDIAGVEKYYQITNEMITETDTVLVSGGLSRATSALERSTWRYGNKHELRTLQQLACRRITDVQAIHDLPIPETVTALKSVFSEYNLFGQRSFQSFRLLLCHPRAFDPVSDALDDYAKAAIAYEAPASERAKVLIDISKLLLANSPDDAKVYFEKATEIVEEMDVEAIDQIYFLSRASVRFPHNTTKSRRFCADMAAVVEYAAKILEGDDHFPYEEVIEALAHLSMPVAICMLSRWTDTGLFYNDSYLQHLLKAGLKSGRIDPVTATALGLIADDTGLDLSTDILEAVGKVGKSEKTAVLDALASRARLGWLPDGITSLTADLSAFASTQSLQSDELAQLTALSDFLDANRAIIKTETDGASHGGSDSAEDRSDKEPPPDGSGVDTTDPAAILDALEKDKAKGLYRNERVLGALRASTKSGDRTKYLDALSALARTEDWPFPYIEEILASLDEWHGAAVVAWASAYLPQLIINSGEWVLRYGWFEPAYLEPLLDRAGLDGTDRVNLILKTIEAHSEDLSSASLYRFAAELIKSLPDKDAETLFEWYLARRKAAQQGGTSDTSPVTPINPGDIPDSVDACIPLLLYRYLGDIDARIRWRAAHAVRTLVGMGRAESVASLIDCRDIGADFMFSLESVPFHHLTAKLWLAMTMARIAFEAPQLIADNAERVLKIATEGPPHLLIAMHVKRALTAASKHHTLKSVAPTDVDALATPACGVEKVEDGHMRQSFGHQTSQDGLRFYFNSMDTLPYWYNRAQKIFADVSPVEFLHAAEHWIVDEWDGDEDTFKWDREPRRSRIERGDYYRRDNRHGSYPVIERHSLYLEWHAMFVVAGDFIKSRKIAEFEDNDDYYAFDGWLRRWDTTYANFWLVDMREPKPAEVKYWQPLPKEDDDWLETIDNSVFLDELTVGDGNDIVLYSSRETKVMSFGSKEGSESVHVLGAFVPPATASALLRALQTTEDTWDYYLPSEPDMNHDCRTDIEGFTMKPAIRRPMEYKDMGFDDLDPMRVGVSGIRAAPADSIISALKIKEPDDVPIQWTEAASNTAAAKYHVWAELADNTSDRELQQIAGRFNNGDILSMGRHQLLKAMNQLGMDLIFSVEFQRTRGDKYGRHKQEEAKESVFDRLYILRRDGSLEDIDGDIGAWGQDC